MSLELFTLGKDRLIELNRPWIGTIKEFKKIVSRDRGSKGDVEGRKKYQAIREFTFIFHLLDFHSQFSNYSEAERLQEAARNAELPDDFDYTKDEDLVLAVNRYRELQNTPALRLYTEAKEGLHTAYKVIRKIRTALEIKLEATDFDEIEGEERNGKVKIVDPVLKLTNNLKALIDITNQIGPALKNIKDQEEEVKKELGEKQALRGGKEKGIREDVETINRPALPQVSDEGINENEESTGAAGMFDDL
jgi:hypothetical protein